MKTDYSCVVFHITDVYKVINIIRTQKQLFFCVSVISLKASLGVVLFITPFLWLLESPGQHNYFIQCLHIEFSVDVPCMKNASTETPL